MELLLKVITWSAIIIVHVQCFPKAGYVHHRIIVPQKIQTIHHTKVIKVPEHHHYYHEKEKIVHIETPKKAERKPPLLPLESEEDDWSGNYYSGTREHSIFKKHAPAGPKNHKRTPRRHPKRNT